MSVSAKKGGRKPAVETIPELVPALHAVLENRTAGDPMREGVVWTDLTTTQIQERLAEKDIDVCADVIRDVLDEHGFRRRRIQKYLDMGSH